MTETQRVPWDLMGSGIWDLGSGIWDLKCVVRRSISRAVQFTGTLRLNVDPLGQYSDAGLWGGLAQCGIDAAMAEHPQGLDRPIEERGSNLSMGQRQLCACPWTASCAPRMWPRRGLGAIPALVAPPRPGCLGLLWAARLRGLPRVLTAARARHVLCAIPGAAGSVCAARCSSAAASWCSTRRRRRSTWSRTPSSSKRSATS